MSGALALALAACMPSLDRPQPRADLGLDAVLLPDLEEDDLGLVDRYVDAPRPDQAVADLRRPDANSGRWYQADSKSCPTFCTDMKLVNAASPEQSMCMSGEVRPQSGIDAGIKFTYPCWPSCTAMSPPLASKSYGINCYLPSQTQDGMGGGDFESLADQRVHDVIAFSNEYNLALFHYLSFSALLIDSPCYTGRWLPSAQDYRGENRALSRRFAERRPSAISQDKKDHRPPAFAKATARQAKTRSLPHGKISGRFRGLAIKENRRTIHYLEAFCWILKPARL